MSVKQKQVLFVCVHNAGRSQMAAGYMRHLSGGKVKVVSAGSAPKESINPGAVEVMLEEGIDIANEQPKLLDAGEVEASDVVITMGCGDACPFFPGKRYEHWVLADPAGAPLAEIRKIRDQIKTRVEDLLEDLLN
jgi:arsenate reductase (thioredoxin)